MRRPPDQYGLEFGPGGFGSGRPKSCLFSAVLFTKLVGPGQPASARIFGMGRSTRVDDVLKVALRPHFRSHSHAMGRNGLAGADGLTGLHQSGRRGGSARAARPGGWPLAPAKVLEAETVQMLPFVGTAKADPTLFPATQRPRSGPMAVVLS
jgi:hypothetical protein